ncbi:hypothetical protein [Deinococcus sp. Leaf326]|uniref:hypothetical protein n=1 Tax=Deinococcus sp. Leaf326 TaxID=1736338 RepID=UPI000ACD07BC|nr:hypothetical protein [Deinococcus sp. Leaf326]
MTDSKAEVVKAGAASKTATNNTQNEEPLDCFVIMPISDQQGYSPGHFTHVYRDIIKPACLAANLRPRRADENAGTNIIQHEILIELLSAPIAICDLSSRNPNVMFELGLRQAFDKPVILIQDELTPQIFDISMLRYTTYRSNRLYNEVVEDQKKIADAIRSTIKDSKSNKSVNSLIKLLSINKAVLEAPSDDDVEKFALKSMQLQLDRISADINRLSQIDNSKDTVMPSRLVTRKFSRIPFTESELMLSRKISGLKPKDQHIVLSNGRPYFLPLLMTRIVDNLDLADPFYTLKPNNISLSEFVNDYHNVVDEVLADMD